MLRIRESTLSDIELLEKRGYITSGNLEYYVRSCYCRTVIDGDKMIALAMADRNDGEIGLIVIDKISDVKKFLLLTTVFMAEAFSVSGKHRLITSEPEDPKHLRWIKYLGFEVAEDQLPEHTSQGVVTYELLLERWVKYEQGC